MERPKLVSHLSGDVTTVYEFDAIVPVPSSAKKPQKKAKESKVGKSKGKSTKGKKRSAKKGQASSFNIKPIIIVLALLALVAGIVVLIIFLTNRSNACSGGTPSIYESAICERSADGRECTFDVTVCTTGCLLGYEEDEYGCIKSCDCATTGNFEGDITHTPINSNPITTAYEKSDHGDGVYRSALQHRIWDNYRVDNRTRIPYVLSPLTEPTNRESVLNEAMRSFSLSTCVDFYPRTTQGNFLDFSTDGHNCRSIVGRIGGRQKIYTRKICEYSGLFQHTMMHSLGFWHEQSRPDRDDFVSIEFDNINEENKIYFSKREWLLVNESKYDLYSIMHSDGYYFSSGSRATIMDKKTSSAFVSQRTSLSDGDISKINKLYNCNLTYTPSEPQPGDNWGQWGDWFSCSSSCGKGNKIRLRECLNLDDTMKVYHGRCGEDFVEREECMTLPCTQGFWGLWSPCSVTCGAGERHRMSCCYPNEEFEKEICAQPSCITTNGNRWSSWNEWESCSRTCGTGFRKRSRICTDSEFNRINVGDCPLVIPAASDQKPCATHTCNITISSWSDWQEWNSCSVTCGGGTQIRNRICSPSTGCAGENYETKTCNINECPRLGKWSEWGDWSLCCNTNKTQRSRTCYQNNNQIDRNCEGDQDSIDNVGRQLEYKDCITQSCSTTTPGSTTTTTTERPPGLLESRETTFMPTPFCVGGDRFIHNQAGVFDDAVCLMLDGTISVRLGDADGITEDHPEMGGSSSLCVNLQPRKIFMGDVNGDGSMDLICHHNGQMYYLYSSPTQVFAGDPPVVLHPRAFFCPVEQGELLIADISHDRKVDFICVTAGEANPFIINEL